MRLFLAACLSVATIVSALPAAAQERSLSFSLRVGASAIPDYPGSDDFEAEPEVGFTFGSLRLGRLNLGEGVRAAPRNGFSISPAFRVIGDRDSSDSSDLEGTEDIDTAVELGFRVKYQETDWMVFGEARRGVTGHSGFTGTVGADFIYRPSDRWLFTAGPRLNFGDDEFADTYFGVQTGGTANFDSFDADGGILGGGLEVAGSYFINDRWAIEGAVSYERLLNDAGDSPITRSGTDDQFRVRLGLSRVFNLNF